MENIKVVRAPEEKFSWTKEILKLKVGESFPAEISDTAIIRQRISVQVKLKEPERTFETDTTTEPGYLTVKRVA